MIRADFALEGVAALVGQMEKWMGKDSYYGIKIKVCPDWNLEKRLLTQLAFH